MRRSLILAFAFLALAVPAASARVAGAPPPFPKLGAGWSHAEINVRIAKQPHTLILDLGRVVSADSTQLVLRESDASLVTVLLAPTTRITLNGLPAEATALGRGLIVATMRIDDLASAAVRVRAVGVVRLRAVGLRP
jgi:hypothetical protein